MDTRLRVGRARAKTEEEVAPQLMEQIKRHQPDDKPPALATDGKGAYREALLETWGKRPAYSGYGRPPTLPQPEKDWQYLQVIRDARIINHPGQLLREKQCPRTTCPGGVIAQAGFRQPAWLPWSV